MSKIFSNKIASNKNKLKKKRQEQAKYRNKIVNFRMTEEEAVKLDDLVKLSGLTKQEYIISCLFDRKLEIKADYRLKDNLEIQIFMLAKTIKKFGKLDEEDSFLLLTILEIYEELKKGKYSEEARGK